MEFIRLLMEEKPTPPEEIIVDCYPPPDMDDDEDQDNSDLGDGGYPALSNLDVLENIFSYLSSTDVKGCRQVCKIWENVATTELGKQCVFSIHEFFASQTFLEVHPHIFRRIKIDLDHLEPNDLIPILTRHRGQIREIVFQTSTTFTGGINTVLNGVEFGYLKKLCFLEVVNGLKIWKVLSKMRARMPTLLMSYSLPKVKVLEFSISETVDGRTYQENWTTFDQLIGKCGNLEELTIAGNYYPDLSNCRELKTLNYFGPSAEITEDKNVIYGTTDFDVPKLIRMLNQVKGKLEKLVLGFPNHQEFDRRHTRSLVGVRVFEAFGGAFMYYLYPLMPKLTRFSVSDAMLFAVSHQSLTQARLPSLKKLQLGSTKQTEFPLKYFLKQWTNSKSTVLAESLALNQFPLGEVEILRKISNTFPNLKNLKLGVTRKSSTTSTPSDDGQLLKRTMIGICALVPNLRELTIQLNFACTLSKLMTAIYIQEFRGKALQKLTLVLSDPRLVTDKGCRNFAGPFRLYPRLALEGFLIKEETRRHIHDFILKWGLDL